MRISFDAETDALTLILSEEPPARTVDVGEGRFVDLDDVGNVIALEVLGMHHGFRLTDLAERFDLEPLFEELRRGRVVAESLRADERLEEVLAAHEAHGPAAQ